MQEQRDLFEENIILAYDEDDPPPEVGYSDLQWWYLNRAAEEGLRFFRLIGFL